MGWASKPEREEFKPLSGKEPDGKWEVGWKSQVGGARKQLKKFRVGPVLVSEV